MTALKTKKKKLEPWVGDYGPHLYGARLHINEPYVLDLDKPMAFDVETDEQDNFVGVAFCQHSDDVYYYSELNDDVKKALQASWLIGHGARFDIDMVQKWGLNTSISSLKFDTKIASYVLNSTLPSHSLKDLGKYYLDWTWPTYKQMVHPDPEHPKTKLTLDKQSVEAVGRYCGMDALATWWLYNRFIQLMNESQRKFFNEIEMPMYQLLHYVEKAGVQIDMEYLHKLDTDLAHDLVVFDENLRKIHPGTYNLKSPKQLLVVLKEQGFDLNTTKSEVLRSLLPHPFIEVLLKYRKLDKLHSTYTQGLLKLKTLPRVHTRFNQVTQDDHGIVTGRLSSSEPNLQNIPRVDKKKPDVYGSKIRRLFIPKSGHELLAVDYSQVEYRLFAHFTQDPVLLEAFKNDRDVHEETGKLVGADRGVGKTLNFAAIYGAQPKKIAQTANITEDAAIKMLDLYWRKMPKAAAWVTRTKYFARKTSGITTLFGRFIPIPSFGSKNPWERMAAERQAVNYVIQGSAAEIIKKAMLNLFDNGILPNLQVHDELLFEVPHSELLDRYRELVVDTMQNCVKLNNVNLKVEVGYGRNWAEAK